MNVSIHQPNYIPHIGYFNKIYRSNIHVIFDDVQFPRGKDWANRNLIKTNINKLWLTVPVLGKSKFLLFNQIKINNDGWGTKHCWNNKHKNNIRNFYCKTSYFDQIYSDLEVLYDKKYNKLIDLNIDLIEYFCNTLGIKTKFNFSSELLIENSDLYGIEKIIFLLKKLNTTKYISGRGTGSLRYIDENVFAKEKIELIWHDYKHPVYNQQYSGDFISHLSILDILFNCGIEESRKLILVD